MDIVAGGNCPNIWREDREGVFCGLAQVRQKGRSAVVNQKTVKRQDVNLEAEREEFEKRREAARLQRQRELEQVAAVACANICVPGSGRAELLMCGCRLRWSGRAGPRKGRA